MVEVNVGVDKRNQKVIIKVGDMILVFNLTEAKIISKGLLESISELESLLRKG